ncbi:hypothetical protein PIROE2DRAFT_19657 [Piromyces sp. E2]|nr:hypothetical protein PIROE2DRAFT_19657 [Piromyces sp. E2]|eukprot:OUM69510.1 hypothetical protein PIROE2DRAFT_19657 [Piromyces sp. E2]
MTYNQIKTLLWRNALLKRRGIFSTILEIALPTFFILLIVLNTTNVEEQYTTKTVVNEKIIPLESTDVFYYDIGLPTFDFIFSPDFNKQKQDMFLDNFKKNRFFNDLTLVDNVDNSTLSRYFDITKNFSNEKQLGNIFNKFNKRSSKNNNDNPKAKLNNTKENTEKVIPSKEYKIMISENENVMLNNYENITYNKISNRNYFGIVFSSITKYTVRFYNVYEQELEESLMNSDGSVNKINNKENESKISSVTSSFSEFLGNKGYYYHKISVVQALVDNAIYETLTNPATSKKIHIFSKTMDKLVIEKESRIKESLVIIGLKRSNFWISWAITYDIVLPQGNNIHKKWHFFITDVLHNNNKKLDKFVYNRNYNNPFVQNDPGNLRRGVEVCNIGKKFKVRRQKYEILNNISFNAYYDEIFAILGHNGAGKTTLLNIMTGIMSASRGEVYYDDIPISGNEIDICRQFGYCPQFDAFNNNMTVAEHVKLYAGIKEIKVDVNEVLKKVDLVEKKNSFPKQLSGGQKRKLSIILALLGSPKFIFLDEPTTGLDPYSRKKVWELLLENKKGCVTFITTHYMDEADLLSDRKMIISNGDIACLGTSLFLKNIFNMNYSLDIQSSNEKDVSLVDEIIKNTNSNSVKTKKITKTKSEMNMEINNDKNKDASNANEFFITTYLLPITLSKAFKDIFNELNSLIKDEKNGIEKYSLTAPTLEEIFIRLENHDPNNKKLQRIMNKPTVYINVENENLLSIDRVFDKRKLNEPSALHQIWSIIKLRLILFLKNKTFVILYTLLPMLLIIFCIYIENLMVDEIYEPRVYKSLDINKSLYNSIQWFKDSSSSGEALDIINIIEKQFKPAFPSADYENGLTISSKKLTPEINYIGGFKGVANDQDLQFTIYKNSTYSFAESIAVNLIYNAALNYYHIKESISVTLDPFNNDIQTFIFSSSGKNDETTDRIFHILPEIVKMIFEPLILIAISMAVSLSISIYGPLTVKERENGITHQLFLNGTKSINYWIAVLISDTICVVIPIVLISIACFFVDISIFKLELIGFILLITLLWTVASLLHQYILCHFYKKYERVSTLFLIINPTISLIVCVISIITAFISTNLQDFYFDYLNNETVKIFMDKYKIFTGLTIILYTPATIVIFYLKMTSIILSKKIALDTNQLLDFLNSKEAIDIATNNSLSPKQKNKLMGKTYSEKMSPSLFDIIKEDRSVLFIVFCIVLLAIVYAVILFYLEKSKVKRLKKNSVYTPTEREVRDKKLMEGPKDVYHEWKRVQQDLVGSNPNSNIAMKVYELNKDFNTSIEELQKRRKETNETNDELLLRVNTNLNKSEFEKMDNRIIYDEKKKRYINRVIDDITYGVNEGECLGLLGPNGAGKTTAISMITGQLSHTHSTIKYGDKDLNETDLSELSLGYCSQSDALWSSLTVKDTIKFYLNICGYPKKDIPQYTKSLIEVCGIESHTNKRVSEISGGTKRKLSLIIAICSSPKYLILDEPSAGMDPFTRRYMWKIISELKKTHETATILTTHSTEEAEALCERIAILIKGRLVCVDTPRSIKMNHSSSYTLEVYTNHPKQFEEFVVKNNIFGLGPGENYKLETSISYQKYFVEMKSENIPDVFSYMEKAKEKYLISQYNFGQYSLEQVFINFINNVE